MCVYQLARYNRLMRTFLALFTAKLIIFFTKLTGRGSGSALPGLWADRIDHSLLDSLSSELKDGIILVTGTNGKTTVSKLILEALEASGITVITNRSGSNLRRGILSSLIKASNLSGRFSASVGLFEVDEASMRRVAKELNPKQIIVLNIFRDQLDRYGELDTTASLIGEAIALCEATVILNSDDPLVASLSSYVTDKRNVVYFGIEALPSKLATADHSVADSDRCPKCSERLIFSRVFYSHLGHYSCPTGHFDRPKPNFVISKLFENGSKGSKFEISISGKRTSIALNLPGVYNLYNGLAAIASLSTSKADINTIEKSLAQSKAAFGRFEEISWRGKKIILLLIKNPTGCTQVLETFLVNSTKPKILLAINDDFADGRDISWLWDVKFELLKNLSATIVTTGTRAAEMSLRLHYADIASTQHSDTEEALERYADTLSHGETGYILPTYTAMLRIRKALEVEAIVGDAWT